MKTKLRLDIIEAGDCVFTVIWCIISIIALATLTSSSLKLFVADDIVPSLIKCIVSIVYIILVIVLKILEVKLVNMLNKTYGNKGKSEVSED